MGSLRIFSFIISLLVIPFLTSAGFAKDSDPVPRTVLALYDGKIDPDNRKTRIHNLAEMPLNHLGLVVKYHDMRKPLPPVKDMKDIRGVLTWFNSQKMPDPLGYIKWAEQVVDADIRFIILGSPGIFEDMKHKITPLKTINGFLGKLGLHVEDYWKPTTLDVRLTHKDPTMTEFERPYMEILTPFRQIWNVDKKAVTYLFASWGKGRKHESDLVVIGSRGSYAAQGYTHYESGEYLEWYLNPFEFFRRALATDELPKPDPTTLSGLRIYYSHIDGDGWRSVTQIENYKKLELISAEVILKEALKPFPDLPVTVAPIGADIDPDWYGTEESASVGRDIFLLPQVEAGSHTYSHPYSWKYFENYSAKHEWLTFLKKREETGGVVANRYAPFLGSVAPKATPVKSIQKMYDHPRGFANFPFDLDKEINGSVELIRTLLPPGKDVTIMQWSGDTTPFEKALRKTRQSGLFNLNGGDTRFDPEYPSHAWVKPIGALVGNQLQIYASTSNENTYTKLWRDRFFGFKHLPWTLRNTETPRRLKPLNIYYHMYSGEKTASLNALLANLRYARTQEIAPVATSTYASIAEGFFSTRLVRIGPNKWRIENRGNMQTIRFDRATFQAVDMEKSRGVIGQRHYQGSLYVALDDKESSPLIALKNNPVADRSPEADKPFLIQGRWHVWDLQNREKHSVGFSAQGFGKGAMVWKVSAPGLYRIELSDEEGVQETLETQATEDGILRFTFGALAIKPVHITFSRQKDIS